jgi:hypothetical protein
MTGYPHLTRRWPFGCVTEGLPTIGKRFASWSATSMGAGLLYGPEKQVWCESVAQSASFGLTLLRRKRLAIASFDHFDLGNPIEDFLVVFTTSSGRPVIEGSVLVHLFKSWP